MEKKEFPAGSNSLRTFLSPFYIYYSYLGRKHTNSGNETPGSLGFTLIELIVALTILGIFAAILIVAINPVAQIQKGNDAIRQSDIKQLANALDNYYDDNVGYPDDLNSLIDSDPTQNKDPYIQSIPQDPNVATPYEYVSDSSTQSNASQWYVIFAKLDKSSSNTMCKLASNCVPSNYTSSGYNFCVYGGNVDCSTIQNMTLSNQ